MADPLVPISWGELFDKVSILEIKLVRLSSPSARAIVRAQLEKLLAIDGIPDTAELRTRRASLKSLNEELWSVEDELRRLEAQQRFDARFIEAARSVYRLNDERGRVKKEIDRLFGSEMSEQKEYPAYKGTGAG